NCHVVFAFQYTSK
ncbi:hypothetical protein D030_4701B, partial [Vibrio parahaemolyticus AQ3810]